MRSVSWWRTGKFSEGEKNHNSSRVKAYVPSLRNATEFYYVWVQKAVSYSAQRCSSEINMLFFQDLKMDLGSRRERDCTLFPVKVVIARNT